MHNPPPFFYHIATLKHNSPILTYCSQKPLEIGTLVEIPLKTKQIQGIVLKPCEKPEFECKEALDLGFYFSPLQCQVASFIASYYCAPHSLSFSIFTPFANDSIQDFPRLNFTLQPLNAQQNQALEFINARQTSLLFGDTGSGKTEIYIHLLNQTLSLGKNALFLMPEISLTPQMEKRLCAVFGDCLAFWHSKISQKAKKQILRDLKDGKVRILAGARSALFLPLAKLDLILIDEEHDDAYKSNANPRYHARDVALYLAKIAKIKIVLGSATPLVSTYHKAKAQNALFRLKGTYFGGKKSFSFCTSSEVLDSHIFDALKENFCASKQAIVFLPTRANFKHLLCYQCGESIECPNCSISLSLHKKDSSLKCHYCHFTRTIPNECPKCGGALQSLRMGTQEFSEHLKAVLPQSNIACFDRDSITTHTQLKRTLEAFNAHKIDILVGTQMLSKGHDYHNVALSVVLGLDYLLYSSDYRAREKALSLMFQLSGRSGRKENGKVLVQTLHQDFFERFLGDYEEFLQEELTLRTASLYPPFMRLALVHFSHKNQEKAQSLMQNGLVSLQTQIHTESLQVEIVGSGIAPIMRISSKWRYLIMLRSHSAKDLHLALSPLRNLPCEIDIDPMEFA
ncbi:primosomal protein N' [Helicobacter sp. MIT 05-5294]|uniref:primosomal protein N' n=1 Tax=Helicobacter sp. MIT 05-5294 TaxID=1548150 RepID=UPI00051FA540|nr:primosomal protein N' [Helicobacter sp. MIT 05-5294]TLD89066.1 primosomal protein N' [Helicobacter sp. MIT 05-5294]